MPQPSQTPLPGRLAGPALLAWLLASCSAAPPVEEETLDVPLQPPIEVRKRLTYDDVLRVDVYPHGELSTGELGRRVDYDGHLDLPLLGPVDVVGLTVDEARVALQARADRFVKNASVAVSVVEYAPRVYYVLGEVETTGPFNMTRPLNALQALSRAGGLTPRADAEEVVLMRVRDDRLTVHRFDARTPDSRGLLAVEPGDLVFVRESGSGTFQRQLMPYLQGLAPPFSAAASLFLVADTLDD
ncbi:MAG: polysaccharide biosynthesis/export family protein [Planctomycetota bacterium]